MNRLSDMAVENLEWIRRKARYYCKNIHEAEDLASETVCKVLGHPERFDGTRNFKPWVLAIMANTYITWYNRRRCILFAGYDSMRTAISEERADDNVTIDTLLAIIRMASCKSANIECVVLYAKGYSYPEIADMTGIPTGTVKSRIANGRRLLRKMLD